MAIDVKGFNGIPVNSTPDNELMVALPKDIDKVGSVGIVAEVHDGSVGVDRIVRPIDISNDYRLRIGQDSLVFCDNFSHTVLNTSKYKTITSSMTAVPSNNTMTINAGGSVTSGHYAIFQTFGYFPLYLSYSMYCEMEIGFSSPGQTGCNMIWGMSLVSTTANPTDGIYFRLSGNILEGVTTNNGNPDSTVLLDFDLQDNVFYHFLIIIHNDECQFWIDDIPYGVIKTPNGYGSPMRSMSAPLSFRVHNAGTPTLASKMLISNILISNGDMQSNKSFSHIMATMGNHSMLSPDGSIAGQTANYTYSPSTGVVAPTTVTLGTLVTHIVSGYSTLGGQFAVSLNAITLEADYLLFSYLVPLGTSVLPGKDLIISRIKIDCINMGAVGITTPLVLQWGIGVGGTAVTLATTDSGTTGARATRRLPLGIQYFPLGVIIGQPADKVIEFEFNPPISCEPGSYVQVLFKVLVGTAQATQIIRGIVTFNGHFE